MKRSEINTIMRDALAFFKENNFYMPPFATWTIEDWNRKGLECSQIVEQQLGWDITDFGSKSYDKEGLFLFTIRNGNFSDLKNPLGKSYAEKIMIIKENQVTPTHFHFQKMEDIINRGGGILVIQLWNSDNEKNTINTPVTVSMDGCMVTVEAGGTIELNVGESICLPQLMYHKFWGKAGLGTVLVGEVSRVNDDYVDNYFHVPIGRFPEIEEDEEPLYLLYNDYKKYYKYFENVKQTSNGGY